MSLIRWSPFLNAFNDLDDLPSLMPTLRPGQFIPAIDMYEDEKEVTVEIQLAGIDPEKVDLSIKNDVLSIRGEGEKQSEVEEKNYYRKEIHRGSFYRSIVLPAKVLGEEAKATAEAGVLKIMIPKTKIESAKHIKIETKNKKVNKNKDEKK